MALLSHYSTSFPSLSLASDEAEGFAFSMGQCSTSPKLVEADIHCISINEAMCGKHLCLCQPKYIFGN